MNNLVVHDMLLREGVCIRRFAMAMSYDDDEGLEVAARKICDVGRGRSFALKESRGQAG